MADLKIEIGAELSQFDRAILEAEKKIDGFVSRVERIGELGDKFTDFGQKLSTSITLPILALGGSALKSYGDIQSLQKGLEAVMGSTEKASAEFIKLKDVAKLPGLGMEEAVRGSINLQAIGVNANKSRNILQQFGNAVATVGKGRAEFERAIYGVQQLANTPFPLGEDLNIIKDAIPQVSKLLTEAFGTSRSDEISKMGKTSQEVLNVILKGLEKLPRVTGGINGAFENMGDSIKTSLGRIGKIIDDNFDIAGIVDKVTEFIDKIISAFEGLDPTLQKFIIGIAAAAAALGPLIGALGLLMSSLPTIMTGVGALTAAFTFLVTPVGLVTAGVIALVAAVVSNWGKINPYLEESIIRFKRLYNESEVFRTAIASIGFAFEALAVVASAALNALYQNFKDVGKGILKIWNGIGEQIEGVLTLDVDKIKRGTKRALEAVLTAGSDLYQNNTAAIDKMIKGIDKAERRWSGFRFNLNQKIKVDADINIDGLSDELMKKAVAAGDKLKDKDLPIDLNIIFKYDMKDVMINPPTISEKNISGNPITFLDDAEKRVLQAKARLQGILSDFNRDFEDLAANGISSSLTDMFSAIGDAIGKGGNVMEAIGKSLLNSFGKFLSEMGALLIKYGTLAIVKGSLDEIIKTGGFQAIAAGLIAIGVGAALSIAGGAIGSRAQSGMNGSSSGTTSSIGSAYNGNSYSTNYSSGESSGSNEVIFRIAGTDLVGALERQGYKNSRLNAG